MTVVRCPHDGGYCNHSCIEIGVACFRVQVGAALSTPWPGFPKGDGKSPVVGTDSDGWVQWRDPPPELGNK